MVMLFCAGFYVLLWLATFTAFFNNGARLRRIAKRTVIFIAALAATAGAVAFLSLVDQIF